VGRCVFLQLLVYRLRSFLFSPRGPAGGDPRDPVVCGSPERARTRTIIGRLSWRPPAPALCATQVVLSDFIAELLKHDGRIPVAEALRTRWAAAGDEATT
jgi:hypothetical protein